MLKKYRKKKEVKPLIIDEDSLFTYKKDVYNDSMVVIIDASLNENNGKIITYKFDRKKSCPYSIICHHMVDVSPNKHIFQKIRARLREYVEYCLCKWEDITEKMLEIYRGNEDLPPPTKKQKKEEKDITINSLQQFSYEILEYEDFQEKKADYCLIICEGSTNYETTTTKLMSNFKDLNPMHLLLEYMKTKCYEHEFFSDTYEAIKHNLYESEEELVNEMINHLYDNSCAEEYVRFDYFIVLPEDFIVTSDNNNIK